MKITSILIISLVSGFLFTINLPRTRYKILRSDNYIQYLYIAFYSIIGFFLSVIIYGIIYLLDVNGYLLQKIFFLRKFNDFILNVFDVAGRNNHVHILNILFINFLLGFLGPLINLSISKEKKRKILKELKKDHYFENLIEEGDDNKLPICLTMSNGKVYIGYIYDHIDPCNDRKEVRILPIVSGYRKDETKKIKFTTYYNQIYKLIKDAKPSMPINNLEELNRKLNHFFIVLPYDEIITSNLFDFTYYKEFKKLKSID